MNQNYTTIDHSHQTCTSQTASEVPASSAFLSMPLHADSRPLPQQRPKSPKHYRRPKRHCCKNKPDHNCSLHPIRNSFNNFFRPPAMLAQLLTQKIRSKNGKHYCCYSPCHGLFPIIARSFASACNSSLLGLRTPLRRLRTVSCS